ncbi:MAG: O-antigen translocase [Muribaculum sp.]|nr:O-antigen translocase [Muribaculum sp.]
MEKGNNGYRSILKGMSFFGGAQVFQILINLVRGKFVAMLLGPEGMGISSLLTTSTNTVRQLASLGLPTAIVKEVSAEDDSVDESQTKEAVIDAARTATLITAFAGALICITFSSLLSRWTFGDDGFSWQFAMLSLAVMFGILGSGEMSILQGLHQVKRLSWSSVVGAATGLAVGVPMYYFWGNDGIAPGMIAVALATYIFYRIYSSKAGVEKRRKVDSLVKRAVMRRLISLGLVLMAGSLIGTLATYLSNAFIRYIGGIDDVGYFQAANSITNQYAGVIFAAMSVDYFPRLVGVASDNAKVTDIVNRQTEVISLIIAPLMVLLMLTAPLLIRIFLTGQFDEAVPLVQWLGMGVFLRALAYPPGYIAFAKSDKRLFFLLEGVAGNVIYLTSNCVCYYLWGLIGLGAAMCITYMLSLVIYYAVNNHRYAYRVRSTTVHTVLPLALLVLAAFIAVSVIGGLAKYIVTGLIFITSATISIRRLFRLVHQ